MFLEETLSLSIGYPEDRLPNQEGQRLSLGRKVSCDAIYYKPVGQSENRTKMAD